jgi:tetratricopeptide (TPR) repeat protein
VTENSFFPDLYQAGIAAFERGQYRLSIQQLTAALESIPKGSREGGDVQIWLISAYQGLGDSATATELCRQLTRHPNGRIREQANQLLYILEAPRLKRPDEWMSQIPDLEKLPDSEPKFQKGSSKKKTEAIPPPMKLDQQRENRFVWVAIGVIGLLFVALIFANSP